MNPVFSGGFWFLPCFLCSCRSFGQQIFTEACLAVLRTASSLRATQGSACMFAHHPDELKPVPAGSVDSGFLFKLPS